MTAAGREVSLIRCQVVVERSIDDTCVVVTANATGRTPWSETVRYRIVGPGADEVDPIGDVALATWLLPAMRRAARLELVTPVSAQLLQALPRVQTMYSGWQKEFATIEVEALSTPGSTRRPSGVGLLFSGGVDSFYTLLTTRDTLTHLVFVSGYDFDRRLSRRSADAIATARAVADHHGLALLVVETDIRNSTAGRDWKYGHGTSLFAVAHALRGVVGTCLVSANDTEETMIPWGTHPELDPLWSSDIVELIHSGFGVSRWDKLRVVGADPMARKHLRVCTDADADAYNCGHCGKCVATAFALHALGELEAVETLPSRFRRREVMRISTRSATNRRLLNESLAVFDRNGDDEMAVLVRRTLAPSRTRRTLRQVRKFARNITQYRRRRRGRR